MSDDLVATLHQAGHDYTDKAADLIKAQAARISELEVENAGLSANQCLHDIHGDESGNLYCPRIAELEAALRKINDKDSYSRGSYGPFAEIARAALEGGKKDE